MSIFYILLAQLVGNYKTNSNQREFNMWIEFLFQLKWIILFYGPNVISAS